MLLNLFIEINKEDDKKEKKKLIKKDFCIYIENMSK